MVMGSARVWKTRPDQVQPQVLGGIVYPSGLSLPQETSSVPVRGSGLPGLVSQNDEDTSELVLVLLAQGKKKRELDLKDPRWQTKEGKQLVAERHRKEMESLVEYTKACFPVSLERSRLLRSSVPDRILQPRPVLTSRTKSDGTQEVKCLCTPRGFKDLTFWTWCEIAKLRAPRCLRMVER